MTHRADRIITAAVTAIAAQATDCQVHPHRRLSLRPDHEVPAISVDFGALDVLLGTEEDLDYYDCVLELPVTVVDTNTSESELRASLLAKSAKVQIALRADYTLGLEADDGEPFVISTELTGWEAPDINVSGAVFAGSHTSNWAVKFRMHKDDPTETDTVPNL